MALDLNTGAVVFGRNPGLSLVPASNEKLPITYTALKTLGPDYRMPTDVLGQGALVGITWRGSLALQGHGGPTLSSAGLNPLAPPGRAAPPRQVPPARAREPAPLAPRPTAP